jgi:hypothetical protein
LDREKVPFADLLNSIEQEQNKIFSISAQSRISIDTEEYSGNFFADLLYNENDSLLISVTGPFGIDVGKMFLGKNRFIFFNQFSDQFYSGDIEDFKDRNFLQFPLKIHEISNFFTGKESIKNMKIIEYEINDNMFYIRGENSDNTFNIWIDNVSGRIKKIEYMKQNSIVLIKEYNKFFKFNDTYFPKHIKLSRPLEKQVVSVYYNKIVLNQKIVPSDFMVNISDSARQIDLNLIELQGQENL